MNKLKLLLAISFSSAVLIACNQNQSSNNVAVNTDSVNVNPAASDVKIVLKNDTINEAYKYYISLKNALVASNVGNAQKAASGLGETLNKIKGCQNTADIAKQIASSSDLTSQRKDFTPLSADFIALLKHADVEEGTIFVQYCPMANSGKGGYWMASNEEVRNPYYGDEMLNCGEVKEKFSKK